jgi:hypothetical protein
MSFPRVEDVGIVRVQGLSVGELVLDPVSPSFQYQSQRLEAAPCAPGQLLRLESPHFSGESSCIEALVVDATAIPAVRREAPVHLDWDGPVDETLSRVHILLDVSHHGGKRGDIVCDVPDTGSFDIPAALVTALVDLGLAGFPSVILTRSNSGTSSAPNVSFGATSTVERPVDTGVRSCLQDDGTNGCPSGQRCDQDSLICH